MKGPLTIIALLLLCISPVIGAPTDASVVITVKNGNDLELQGRKQLEDLLVEYDVEPWIITQEILIESHVIPHSHPVLTLNTQYLDDDLSQLATFIHEQLHWYLMLDENDLNFGQAFAALESLYPDPPTHEEAGVRDAYSLYLHLMVNWLEYDALRQLAGEEKARAVISGKRYYTWIYRRVLEDDLALSVLLEQHRLLINAEDGHHESPY